MFLLTTEARRHGEKPNTSAADKRRWGTVCRMVGNDAETSGIM